MVYIFSDNFIFLFIKSLVLLSVYFLLFVGSVKPVCRILSAKYELITIWSFFSGYVPVILFLKGLSSSR